MDMNERRLKVKVDTFSKKFVPSSKLNEISATV